MGAPIGTLVFDGECGFCTRSVTMLNRLDRHGRIRRLPLQSAQARRVTGLDQARLRESVRWVTPAGECWSGAHAVNAALAAAIGTRLPLLVYRLPGMRALQEAAYRWVSANRHRLPGTVPWCQHQPHACDERL